MQILPAVDILGGKCVQLVGGEKSTATVYGTPLENAQRWISQGADALHVVNLDGAFSASAENVSCIREVINETDVFIEVGGGIRSLDDARGWLNLGVDRIIISTFAVRSPESVASLAEEFGSDRICAGVDARGSSVSVEGWTADAGDYISWAKRFAELGAGSLLYTNIDVEGKQAGVQTDPIRRLIEAVPIPVLVSGGVSSADDVRSVKALGAGGCILGSALYSGKITLQEALEAEHENC